MVNSITGININFFNTATGNFHLRSGAMAKDKGYNIPSTNYLYFIDDFEGEERFDFIWDIGADEAPSLIALHRSVGNDPTNLNTGNATITVVGTTTTFSTGLPTNIGIGDAVVYGAPSQLGFIAQRVSSSTYELHDWRGVAPTATTSATAAIYRSFRTLSDWATWQTNSVNSSISATVRDYVARNNQDLSASSTAMYVACYASTTPDTASVTINGWETSSSSLIQIFTPSQTTEVGLTQRHDGKWNDNKYRLVLGNGNGITVNEDFVNIIGLAIKTTDGINNNRSGIEINSISSTSAVYLTNNVIANEDTANVGIAGIYLNDDDGSYYVYNNIIYGQSGTSQYGIRVANGYPYIYNNTIGFTNTGFYQAAGTAVLTNNALFNNTADFTSAGSYTAAYNASDDQFGANWINISPNVNEENSWKYTFTDYINYDFSIRWMFSPLYDSGTPVNLVTNDIISATRPTHDAYDIGAFEYTAGRPNYRFEGKTKIEGKVRME